MHRRHFMKASALLPFGGAMLVKAEPKGIYSREDWESLSSNHTFGLSIHDDDAMGMEVPEGGWWPTQRLDDFAARDNAIKRRME